MVTCCHFSSIKPRRTIIRRCNNFYFSTIVAETGYVCMKRDFLISCSRETDFQIIIVLAPNSIVSNAIIVNTQPKGLFCLIIETTLLRCVR